MVTIGRNIQQKGGFKAFIPERFPPKGLQFNTPKIVKLLSEANLLFPILISLYLCILKKNPLIQVK